MRMTNKTGDGGGLFLGGTELDFCAGLEAGVAPALTFGGVLAAGDAPALTFRAGGEAASAPALSFRAFPVAGRDVSQPPAGTHPTPLPRLSAGPG